MLPVETIECLKVTPLISLCCFITEWMFIHKDQIFLVTVLELLGCHVDGVKNGGI